MQGVTEYADVLIEGLRVELRPNYATVLYPYFFPWENGASWALVMDYLESRGYDPSETMMDRPCGLTDHLLVVGLHVNIQTATVLGMNPTCEPAPEPEAA